MGLFIGIDLGGKEKKTTGVCILEKKEGNVSSLEIWCQKCQDFFGKDILKKIGKYLKETEVIAIDALLTAGQGKGKMRLYEKFLSTKIFRKEKVNPIPPALMSELCEFARELVKKLEKKGFVLGLNLIEVFSVFTGRILEYSNIRIRKNLLCHCQSENQKMALICAILAFFHSNFKTRYLGYKDGFLFLPELSLWKKKWRQKFYRAWRNRPKLKYRRLITNIFI